MGEPRFELLDVVRITDTGWPHLDGIAGAQGVVTQRRRYPDGRFRYVVAASDHDDADGIWDEAHLVPTDEKCSLDFFAPPGRYRIRDVVVIHPADEADAALSGARGVIDGWTEAEVGHFAYLVLIEDSGEQKVCVLSEPELSATGERLAPPQPERSVTSTRVSEAGDVLGHLEYVILDDVSDYL